MSALLLTNLAATLFMTGLIWFVQLVHYPLFAAVGAGEFRAYHAAHSKRTTLVVLPVMLTEAATALLLPSSLPSGAPATAAWCALLLLALVWASTALLQVPRHRRLGRGVDATAVRALGAGNWARTIAWSARAALLLWITATAASGGRT